MRNIRAVSLALLVLAPSTVFGQSASSRELVRRAVLDYVEGFYEGDSLKLVRSVRPDVYKVGFAMQGNDTAVTSSRMPFSAFFSVAQRLGQSKRFADAPKDVVVFDVLDQIASAKVTAGWGTDYLLLAKYDGQWMIAEVLWQAAR